VLQYLGPNRFSTILIRINNTQIVSSNPADGEVYNIM
jgi:hypothetical protein